VIFALLVFALATSPLHVIDNPLTRFLGKISYSSYLFHFAALDVIDTAVIPVVAGRPLLHLLVLGGGR
jgi:peptidoglycan/LPS O-acetylase OafA/YrhL